MPSPLESLNSADFVGLTVWKTAEGFQASISADRQSWTVAHGATPGEAIAALFAPVPVHIPPPPY